MTKEQIFALMNQTVTFYLATVDGGEPRVRGMMLYSADADGIVFHTGAYKDVYAQIQTNPQVQMCFVDPNTNTQVRVRGTLEELTDTALKDEIANHPARGFVKAWRDSGTPEAFYSSFKVFCLRGGLANVWTFDTNFLPKEDVQL